MKREDATNHQFSHGTIEVHKKAAMPGCMTGCVQGVWYKDNKSMRDKNKQKILWEVQLNYLKLKASRHSRQKHFPDTLPWWIRRAKMKRYKIRQHIMHPPLAQGRQEAPLHDTRSPRSFSSPISLSHRHLECQHWDGGQRSCQEDFPSLHR